MATSAKVLALGWVLPLLIMATYVQAEKFTVAKSHYKIFAGTFSNAVVCFSSSQRPTGALGSIRSKNKHFAKIGTLNRVQKKLIGKKKLSKYTLRCQTWAQRNGTGSPGSPVSPTVTSTPQEGTPPGHVELTPTPTIPPTVTPTPSPDTDNDGLPDIWELQMLGTLSHSGSSDPDQDSWTNMQEYLNSFDPNSFTYGAGLEICDDEIDNDQDGLIDCRDVKCHIPKVTYYASPTGGGNGQTQNNPMLISDFWNVAEPGDTLLLLDGFYNNEFSTINPPDGLSGEACRPITVKALHDGQATIDGQSQRSPVYLSDNSWFVLEGFSAHHSNWTVVNIGNNSNYNLLRRITAWDAANSNTNIFGVHYADFNIIEDCAGWGIARKTYESSYYGNNTTLRRVFGIWDGSTAIGLKMTFAMAYNNYQMHVENAIGGWRGAAMPETYVLTDYSSPPQPCYLNSSYNTRPECLNLAAATYTNYTVQNPWGIFAYDRLDGDKKARSEILGSLAYTLQKYRPTDLQGGLVIAKLAEMSVRDTISYMEDDVAPFELSTPSGWRANYAYTVPWSNSGVIPSNFNGHYYEPISSGITGSQEPVWPIDGGTVEDGSLVWKDQGLLNLSASNISSFKASLPSDIFGWSVSNHKVGSSDPSAPRTFRSAQGADLCFRYANGVKTDKPLWPWPMNQRIKDAMIASGYEEVDVTQTVEESLGSIPAECRND